MSDYKFDVGDVGKDAETEEEESNFGRDALQNAFSSQNLTLMPLTIFAVYAFLEKAAVIGALTSLFGGAEGLALAVGTTAWVAGGFVVAGIALLAIATVVAILVGLVTRSPAKLVVGVLGAIYFGVGYAGATYVFGALPLLVGFMLTSTIVIWGGFLLVGLLGVVGAIIVA